MQMPVLMHVHGFFACKLRIGGVILVKFVVPVCK